ncbi:family 20 glycosylhydrolase [Salinibacterium sp. G-O1]|uniref:family 20 glycosylhydrolase n=1 Tax=Salinibacterium sp. G-O1 TaxID=3046208 RepID=UPI0024BA131C|nr:family 20 glycosylhydrolase [Salinibacterium sp. G-O1]MDJ0335992.1 family 20 glycosylhydrolase [Salinibacterium sp. G-O1]
MTTVIPAPVRRIDSSGTFTLTRESTVGGDPAAAGYVAVMLGLSISDDPTVEFALGSSSAPEGYTLRITSAGIRAEADSAAGLFYAAQTLRQLLPADQATGVTSAALPITEIEDYPRFAYRGAMLDVARHFFGVDDVKKFIDNIALLKVNHLHLHLTDDQGWRIQIDSWPELTKAGATTEVGGTGGGFYSKDQYREIVRYAASLFITIVPEIDLPGHTNAASVAYPELSDIPVSPYEGVEVGFSSLAIRSETTYTFVDDVIREMAALTPGPYLHLGGDESLATTDDDFLYFIERATAIAATHGKTLIGWHEMGRSTALPAGTVGQYWSFTTPQEGADEHTLSFVRQGGPIIMSPADVAYLDIKYDASTELGLTWADGPTSIAESYEWEPTAIVPGIGEAQLLGVEAPIWTETLATIADVEYMAFPRLASIAEIAWSPAGTRDLDEFTPRLERFVGMLDALGIQHHRLDE